MGFHLNCPIGLKCGGAFLKYFPQKDKYTKKEKRIALWSAWIKGSLLLITPKPECKVFDFQKRVELIKEVYHESNSYRYPGTDNRIRESVIRKNCEKCNVIF